MKQEVTGWNIGKHYIQVIPLRSLAGYTNEVERRDVVLLAVSGIWAMVRRPKCIPYVCEVKQLEEQP